VHRWRAARAFPRPLVNAALELALCNASKLKWRETMSPWGEPANGSSEMGWYNIGSMPRTKGCDV